MKQFIKNHTNRRRVSSVSNASIEKHWKIPPPQLITAGTYGLGVIGSRWENGGSVLF